MARLFDITTTNDTLTVAAGKTERLVYTVSCTATGRKQRAIVRRYVLAGGQAAWVNFAQSDAQAGSSGNKDQIEREFPPATQQIDLAIAIPAGTPAGQFRVRLDALSVDNPDDDFTEGPVVSINVPAPIVTPPKKMPWWIWLVIAAVVLLIVGVITFLAVRKHKQGDGSSSEQTSSSASSPEQTGETTQEFNDPRIEVPQGRLALDVCREPGTNCGKPAADAFCVSQNMTASVDFRIAVDSPPTVVISNKQVCVEAGCDRITWVKCSTAARPVLRINPLTMQHLQMLRLQGKNIVQ